MGYIALSRRSCQPTIKTLTVPAPSKEVPPFTPPTPSTLQRPTAHNDIYAACCRFPEVDIKSFYKLASLSGSVPPIANHYKCWSARICSQSDCIIAPSATLYFIPTSRSNWTCNACNLIAIVYCFCCFNSKPSAVKKTVPFGMIGPVMR